MVKQLKRTPFWMCGLLSLIENSLVEKLNVTGINKQFVINTVNGTSEINSKEVPITVTSLDGNNNVKIPIAWAVPKPSISPDSILKADDTSKWQHLQEIDLPEIDVKHIWEAVPRKFSGPWRSAGEPGANHKQRELYSA